jgi:redox-sensitive bicupin YhaK (pirin superfamily)
MTMALACASFAATSGASAGRSKVLPRTPLSRRLGPTGARKTLPVETARHAFAYVFEGSGSFQSASQPFGVLTENQVDGADTLIRERTGNRSLVLFDRGDEVVVQGGEDGIRFLLVSGKPMIHDRMPVILHAKDHDRWLSYL